MNVAIRCLAFLLLSLGVLNYTWSCTIFCSTNDHKSVWVGNNEDFYFFDFTTQITVVSKTDSAQSFFFFHYGDFFPQGGVNESGLFFDGNAVESSEIVDFENKKAFPDEIFKVSTRVMQGCKTVVEAIEIFDTYQIPWIRNAQLHFVDKLGNKGIVTADSSWISGEKSQVSTNYNLSHDDDDYKKCWRYPLAQSMLSQSRPGFELFSAICDSTSQQKDAYTIYSNVHNLTTGEIRMYYGLDYNNPYTTTFDELLALGDTTFMIRNLFSKSPLVKAYEDSRSQGFDVGMDAINSIANSSEKEEKLRLLIVGLLFEYDKVGGEIAFTENNELVRQVIETTMDADILSVLAGQKISKPNRELLDIRLREMNASEEPHSTVYLLAGVGIFIVLLLAIWVWFRKYE